MDTSSIVVAAYDPYWFGIGAQRRDSGFWVLQHFILAANIVLCSRFVGLVPRKQINKSKSAVYPILLFYYELICFPWAEALYKRLAIGKLGKGEEGVMR